MVKYNFDIISKILPINCEAYLKNKGWAETGKIGEVAKLFGKADDGGHFSEVLVPSKIKFNDFENSIFNLLIALQDFERRPLEYIANDIVLSKYDVFRITAFKGDTISSLPLEDASKLFDNSLAMMASVAQSIISQQPYFHSRRPNEVNEFLSKLRMGHTERGSFIVTLQTPIAPDMRLEPAIAEEPSIAEEPFERQVTTRLCSLISEATTIANESNSEALTKSVTHGMSANFFEALADITSVCGDTGANLDMTWATIRPIQQAWNIPDNFVVKREFVDSLREAGRTLRTRLPEMNVELAGFVTTLHREAGADVGTIKLIDINAIPQRLVTIDLASDKYEIALNAHEKGNIVVVRGDLRKSARVQTMTNISEFKVESL